MIHWVFLFFVLGSAGFGTRLAFAEAQAPVHSGADASSGVVPEQSEAQSDSIRDSNHQRKKKHAPREREAEGTQAPNRFDQDLIIKSRYELNGQSLEVDTD